MIQISEQLRAGAGSHWPRGSEKEVPGKRFLILPAEKMEDWGVLRSSGREIGRWGILRSSEPEDRRTPHLRRTSPSSKNSHTPSRLPSDLRARRSKMWKGSSIFETGRSKMGGFFENWGKVLRRTPHLRRTPFHLRRNPPPIFEEPLFYLRRTPNLCSSIPKIEKPLPSHLRSSKPKIRSKVAMGISPICNEFTQTKKHQSTGQQQETKNRWSSANKLLVNGGSNAVVLLPSVYI